MNFFFSRSVAVQESSSSESGTPVRDCSGYQACASGNHRGRKQKKPLQRPPLGEKLAERGISISRRTVAKYREEGKAIADASGRKEYV